MLSGVRVVEMGTAITAPLAAMMLADLGADVIKVERPEGDTFRRARGGTYSPNFVAFNRNKRSVTLDLTGEKDRAVMMDILANTDVMVDNFRPGVLDRLGLAPAELREKFPRLIICSVTGFGATGPLAGHPAFDAVAQARSGIAGMLVDPEQPEAFGPTMADNATGMYAATAIVSALFERQRTGEGRRLEVSMLEASMGFITDAFANWTQLGIASDRYSRVASSQSFSLHCGDGKLIAIHLSTQQKFWDALVAAIDNVELAADSRFKTREGRVSGFRVLQAELNRYFLAQPRAEWERRLEIADVPFSPINTAEEVLADPQVAAMGSLFSMPHPALGSFQDIACPVLVDGVRPRAANFPAPQLGEHTAQVVEEFASRLRPPAPNK